MDCLASVGYGFLLYYGLYSLVEVFCLNRSGWPLSPSVANILADVLLGESAEVSNIGPEGGEGASSFFSISAVSG